MTSSPTTSSVHRRIHPNSFLIDFGISRPIVQGVSCKPDALSATKRLIGSPHWASLNAHRGLGASHKAIRILTPKLIYHTVFGPRDDLESLSLTALFLVRGDLPWRTIPGSPDYFEPEERCAFTHSRCESIYIWRNPRRALPACFRRPARLQPQPRIRPHAGLRRLAGAVRHA